MEPRSTALQRDTIVETGLATPNVAGRAGSRSWIARVQSGPDAGRQLVIGARPVVAGAHRSCELVLSDPKVSSRHVELVAEPRGVRLRDLGSTNGTFIQGAQVREATVPDGASVELGDSSIRLSASALPILPPSARSAFGGLVGKSVAMRELFAVLELASPATLPVLIQGESGTGKELAALAIHDHSPRAGGRLVVVDCTAMTETLVESQLFGHRRGAFTGADADRKGAFVEADGGTLFLDELGELPLALQAKLLRTLEQGTVVPVGADLPTRVDVRVVAATHRDLAAMVGRGEFRFDLFHRLAVVHVAIPPLREHTEDLAELVGHFYRLRGVRPQNLECENMDRLRAHAWPGNVRELRNVLERSWALAGQEVSDFAALRLWLAQTPGAPHVESVDAHLPFKDAKERWLDRFERRYLAAVIHDFEHNISRGSAHAGLSRRHFRELLKKHGLHGADTTDDE